MVLRWEGLSPSNRQPRVFKERSPKRRVQGTSFDSRIQDVGRLISPALKGGALLPRVNHAPESHVTALLKAFPQNEERRQATTAGQRHMGQFPRDDWTSVARRHASKQPRVPRHPERAAASVRNCDRVVQDALFHKSPHDQLPFGHTPYAPVGRTSLLCVRGAILTMGAPNSAKDGTFMDGCRTVSASVICWR